MSFPKTFRSCALTGACALSMSGHAVTAFGASSEAADNQLEQIVVTAEKREERLIDTPISIGVLSGRDLDQSSSLGVGDALPQVGGISMVEQRPGQADIAVRGILQGGGGTGSVGYSPTAYYQDEVPLASFPDTNAFDLARIEVLRGPQGTLYGASALGGVVRMLTNDAHLDAFEVKGRARTSSTEDGGTNYGGDLAVNLPLIEGKLAIRVVASYSNLSGFVNSTFAGETQDINDAQEQAFRVKVNYQATDSLSIKGSYTRSRIATGAPSLALDDFSTPFPAYQPEVNVLNTYNLLTEYKWSKVSLLSSTSYVDAHTDSGLSFLLFGTTLIKYLDLQSSKAFSQEFRLASHLEGPWQWSAGAFYEDTTSHTIQCCLVPFQFFFPYPSSDQQHPKSSALFSEVTRSFDEGKFDLTAGVRYFRERLITTEYSRFTTGTAILIAPTPADFDHVTGRLVLAYKPREDSMFYGDVATGFRSGLNQSASVLAVDPTFGPVKPDSITTYELGTKGRALDGALTYDIAVYHSTWKPIQQSVVLVSGFTALLNTGTARGPGVDTDLSYQLTQALTLQASIGWNDIKFASDYSHEGVLLIEKGTRLNESPEWTGSVGGRYKTSPFWAGTRAVVSSNFAFGSPRSFRYLTAGQIHLTNSDNMYNLRASAGLESDHWSVDIYGDNLSNDRGSVTGPAEDIGFTSVRARPRTIGLQVSFNY